MREAEPPPESSRPLLQVRVAEPPPDSSFSAGARHSARTILSHTALIGGPLVALRSRQNVRCLRPLAEAPASGGGGSGARARAGCGARSRPPPYITDDAGGS